MSMRNVTRCILQDVRYKRSTVLILLGIAPLFLAMSVLPLTSISVATWSSLYELILSFRFEFFFIPLFLLLIGSLTNLNDWILVRRYRRREYIALYDTTLVLAVAGLFTLTVFGCGLLISTLIQFLIYPNFPGYAAIFLYRPERTAYPSVILFILLFYLVISSIGLLYVLLKGLTNHNVLAAILSCYRSCGNHVSIGLKSTNCCAIKLQLGFG